MQTMRKGVMSFKDLLKHIFPPPVHEFNREVERILDAVDQSRRETNALRKSIADQDRSLNQLRNQLNREQECRIQWESQLREEWRAQQVTLSKVLEQSALGLQKQINALRETLNTEQERVTTQQTEVLEKQLIDLENITERARSQAADSARHASEAVWAHIFNNTVSKSLWLKDTSFSPGRWAVGYPYLYVMYRVLNEIHPKHILELGLGQSTRMIAQYAAAFNDVEHIVVEDNPEWTEFFCHDFSLPKNTKIVMLEQEMIPYKDADAVRVFKGFKETFLWQKFDFISIDAPLGGDMKQYARIDVMNLIPNNLGENFVIMVDDCNRVGESNTVKEIEVKLTKLGIPFSVGKYCGRKDSVLICDKQFTFLTTM